MPRGGKREGAGRKKGSGTKRTAKTNRIAAAAAGEGPLPLEVMLAAMRGHYAADQLDKAAAIAAQAAPYLHRRLASVQHQGDPAQPLRVIEQLVIADGDADQAASGPPGPGGVSPQ